MATLNYNPGVLTHLSRVSPSNLEWLYDQMSIVVVIWDPDFPAFVAPRVTADDEKISGWNQKETRRGFFRKQQLSEK